ncbi:MAG: hypothetical protein LBK97_00085 [Prevotellaceae bacterium]|nr:hypothetical protein [Prevotellaceae bacterium]
MPASSRNLSRIEKRSFSGIDEIRFEHSFGNITVTESDSGQAELEIQYYNEVEDSASCETSIADNVLTVKTVYPKREQKQDKRIVKINFSDHTTVRVNYIIAIPRNVAMKINLKHGSIGMGDFHGDFTCDVSFGNLNAGTFFYSPVYIKGRHSSFKTGRATVLNFSGDFSTLKIDTADALNIKSKHSTYKIDRAAVLTFSGGFSTLKIGMADTLNINSRHSTYKVGKVRTVKADCAFGNIDINSAGEFTAKLAHAPVTVDNLDRKLNLDCRFSNVKIGVSSGQLESVKFSGSHSNLNLSLDPGLSADFYANLKHGRLSIDDKYKFKYSLQEKDSNRIVKKGILGDKTPTAKIDISGLFGNISIK